VREKHCWMAADSADKSKRTGRPGPGFEVVSLQNFCGGKTLLRLFLSPDPTRVGASGTGSALYLFSCS
jgi:hypothetical protein